MWATAAFLMLAYVLTGCGASAGGDSRVSSSESPTSAASPAGSASAASTRTAAPPGAADGSNVRSCRDGKCAIAVSRPVSFSVQPRLGVTKVSVAAIDPDVVTVRAKGPGISLQVVVRVGSTGRLNGIGVRVVAIIGGTAVLRFSPT